MKLIIFLTFSGVESVAVCDGARGNVDSKSLESSKVVQPQQPPVPPPQQLQQPAPCLSHIPEPKGKSYFNF